MCGPPACAVCHPGTFRSTHRQRSFGHLPPQLDASKSELEMSKEQYELDTFELSEENAKLRRQVEAAKAAVAKAEKTAAQSTAALERRKNT